MSFRRVRHNSEPSPGTSDDGQPEEAEGSKGMVVFVDGEPGTRQTAWVRPSELAVVVASGRSDFPCVV